MRNGPGQSAEEFLAELEADSDWVAARSADDARVRRIEESARDSQSVLLRELSAVGLETVDVWQLQSDDIAGHPEAVPILVSHLRDRAYAPAVREGIVQALGTPAAATHWTEMFEVFAALDEEDANLRERLAGAMSLAATREQVSQVQALLRETSYGRDRVPFLRTLTRLRTPNRWQIIEEFLADPDLRAEAEHLLHRRRRRLAKDS